MLLNKILVRRPMINAEFTDATSLTTYAGKKVTFGVGHFQIIDFFYDW